LRGQTTIGILQQMLTQIPVPVEGEEELR
jgi:hypothetical protein